MKTKKVNKRQVKAFMRWRVKWAEYKTGLHVPFGGYVTKGEFLQILKNLMEAYPNMERYKEEYNWYKNQSAPLDQKIFKIEADDKYMGTRWCPMFFQEYIGTDDEWVSPERRKAYEDWKTANGQTMEPKVTDEVEDLVWNSPEAALGQSAFDTADDWDLAKRIADDAMEEPFDAEDCPTADEGTRAMMDAEWEAERERALED